MSYTKYIDALAKMDDIVSLSANVAVPEDKDELTAIHTQWDELYTFVYANFKAPASKREPGESGKDGVTVTPEVEKELESMKAMFKLDREEIEEQLYEIPPKILEQCFPVWMARYMLAFGRVPVMPAKLTTFTEFHHMYGYMIIYSN